MTIDFRTARIGVLLGGMSSEREISLRTGRPMADALRRSGYTNLVEIDVNQDVALRLKEEKVEVALLALHGTYGEDGCIQGLLEIMGIPYTGSGVCTSAMAMDKAMSKLVFQAEGLPTAPYKVLQKKDLPTTDCEELVKSLGGLPVVTKPVEDGSSVGITIVKKMEDLISGITLAANHGDGRVMMEKFISGTEVTAGVLNGVVLGTTEIEPATQFYDYETKYNRTDTRYHTPARISAQAEAKIRTITTALVKVMRIHGPCRTDFIVDKEQTPWLLEVNTLPGMTDHSLLPMCAKLKGLSYDQLVEQILLGARCWH